jgi:2-polyprenyl-6-methoxyphenol hydroxylase-like FAD-dependent oxidoreductase
VLRNLGLLDQVAARAAPIHELYARHHTGGTLLRTRYGDFEPGCHAYGVHRGVLFNALYAAVRTQPVDVRLACEMTERTVGPDGVTLHDACGHRHGPFDFVVAADGARSAMRRACRMRSWVYRYPHGTLWAILPGAVGQSHLLQVVAGNRHLFGLLPLGEGLCTLYWGLPTHQFEATRRRGLDALKAEIARFCPEAGDLLDLIIDFEQFLLTSYQHVVMSRWYDRHTVFIGDACHAMSPHLGQGINLAMVDAYRLAACLRAAPDPPSAFRAYHRLQKAYVRYYATVTFALSPFFQSDVRPLGWVRDLVLPLLPKVPFVKPHMLLTVAGLKGDFLAGRMTV